MHRNIEKKLIVLLAIITLAGGLYFWLEQDLAVLLKFAVAEETHPALFLLLFALLPIVGFPISVFLVLLGAKFGAWPGVLIMFAGMPLHLAAAYLITHSLLRGLVRRSLEKMNYAIPQIPPNRSLWFSLVFMAVPGLSYTMKNFALALCGVPFRHYFLGGYGVQAVMGIPLVIAGKAFTGMNLYLLALVFMLLFTGYIGLYRLRQRHLARQTSTKREEPRD